MMVLKQVDGNHLLYYLLCARTGSQHVAQAGLELIVLIQFLKGCSNVSEQCLYSTFCFI